MTQELFDKWEARALRVFTEVYKRQWRRTKGVIDDAEREEIRQLIDSLYRGEPASVRLQVQKFFDDVVEDVSVVTVNEVGRPVEDVNRLTESILQLSSENATRFSKQISENSLRLSYSVIDDWLETEGATKDDLIKRMQRIWKGSRPQAAATTETTRLVNDSRVKTFEEVGAWGFQPLTREDDNVRPTHKQYAKEGPYPLSRSDRIPPYGDVNCRCTITVVLDAPRGL